MGRGRTLSNGGGGEKVGDGAIEVGERRRGEETSTPTTRSPHQEKGGRCRRTILCGVGGALVHRVWEWCLSFFPIPKGVRTLTPEDFFLEEMP